MKLLGFRYAKNHHPMLVLKPKSRRILQAILYEVFAIAFVGPILSFIFDKPASSTLLLAMVLSSIALSWNYIFNSLFERWEARQAVKGRSFLRRFVHGIGFEGGLVVILVPVMALWLNISALSAFIANLGFFVFFFIYAIVSHGHLIVFLAFQNQLWSKAISRTKDVVAENIIEKVGGCLL